MNRNLTSALLAAAGSASPALAQLGTATVTWEANDGSGWTSGRLETTAPSVEVRMRVAWDPLPSVGYAFASTQFDAVTRGPAAALDTITNARRLTPFDGGSAQTLAVTRFGDVLKIDDARDTSPPGTGPRGVFPGQLVQNFGHTTFSTINPVSVFAFTLQFDPTPGTRRVNSFYIPGSTGDTISRYLRLYVNPSGSQNIPSSTTLPLDIVYIPTPSTAAIALLLGAMKLTRRRR